MKIVEDVKEAFSGASAPKHTKESDFERLKKEHRRLCQSALDLNAEILIQFKAMAEAGNLSAEFRPIILYAADAYKAMEEAKILGDEVLDEYRRVMARAVPNVDKENKRKEESRKIKEEIGEIMKKRVGTRGEGEKP